MPPEQNQQWLPVLLIAGALAAWGVLLAVGAWLAPGGDEARQGDFRKLWVVAGMVGGFLLLWGGVLAVRARKLRRGPPEEENP
jgi:hypothetical protein